MGSLVLTRGGQVIASIPVNQQSCTTVVSTASQLAAALNTATAGSTICLAAGSYGTFTGGVRNGVTLRPAPGVAQSQVKMALSFNPGANITVEGVTLTGAELQDSRTRNVTIRNCNVTGDMIVRTWEWANANVLIDGCTFLNISRQSTLYDGRLSFPQRNENAACGVTVTRCLFAGGTADGILNGANGLRIIGNEFRDIVQPASGDEAHADSIQLYGSKNTLIQGNYIHGSSVCIMAPDGGDHETIVDNVFVGRDYRPAIQMGDHVGTRFEHNTVRNVDVFMDSKGSGASRDGVLRDNVMMNSSFNVPSGECRNCLVASNLMGGAVFVGGTDPRSYAGHKLAPGSPGVGAATDGTDQGARFV